MIAISSILDKKNKIPRALHFKFLRESLIEEFNKKFVKVNHRFLDRAKTFEVSARAVKKIDSNFYDDPLKEISFSRDAVSLDRVIEILRGVDAHERGPFYALGIFWRWGRGRGLKSTVNPSYRNNGTDFLCPWIGTANLLRKASTKDALEIFCALAKSIDPNQAGARTELMHIALSNPSWARQAIEMRPEVFVNKISKFDWMNLGSLTSSRWTNNAYVVMASIALPGSCVEDIQAILQALKKAGVHPPACSEGVTVLHLAAAKQTPAGMTAFAHHFSGIRYSKNRLGETADHLAARGGRLETLAALLEVKIPDMPDKTVLLSHLGDSPLDEAVKSKNIDCVKVICNLSNPSAQELMRARSWASGEQIKAFLNAQIAHHAIEESLSRMLSQR